MHVFSTIILQVQHNFNCSNFSENSSNNTPTSLSNYLQRMIDRNAFKNRNFENIFQNTKKFITSVNNKLQKI